MNILIIDGQSGRMGAQLIEGLRKAGLGPENGITAIGTNALATGAMLKAGADQAATGENPVLVQCRKADIIAGPIGIVLADALLGEITPKMAAAVGQSDARRILLPVNQCRTSIPGTANKTRAQLTEEAVQMILQLCKPQG
ncbi:MAG: DUF3842 family protein [Clostridia bacterium]|nr:DUF3842 family protein [Clostridia bacterium]MBR2054731.1 DUF3842 family protein [Clostridia bacterium]